MAGHPNNDLGFSAVSRIAILCIALLCPTVTSAFAEDSPSISAIFEKESGAVVLVGSVKNNKLAAAGSGFVVRSDGIIVTNYHIVKGSQRIFVKFKDERIFPDATITDYDADNDMAIITVEAANLKCVTLGNSDRIKVGERIIAIGNPLGFENTISDGLISAVRNSEKGRELLQTSVPLSKGSSGSPLFDLKGEVIGMTVSGVLDGQNLNFAVPINFVKAFLKNSGYVVADKRAKPAGADRAVKASGGPDAIFYQVRPKDTLYGIARQFNTTVNELMRINDLSGSKILVGQKLIVKPAN